MTDDHLFTREEVLAGLPARRASTLLFLIESRTAHLVAQSRQAMERFLTEEAAEERDLAFLEAFALGRDPPLRPTIQDLERYAPQWAPLVPENPRVRAAIAHLLGQKYSFTYQAVPGTRAALGLDEEAVQQAYQHLYREPLENIYAPQVKPVDRLRWTWAALGRWLESLPPFWTAFALTLTETVGAGILALPIAVAGVGPLAGVLILVVLGVVNVLTVASMAEAVAHNGTIRYGSAFVGRMVADLLGSAGSLILSLGLMITCFLALLAYYIGFSTTLADATHVPAEVWVVVFFTIGLYFLRRESLDATVASALGVGAINIGLILTLSLLAFTRMQPASLLYVNVPFLGGRPFEPAILRLVFGVILSAYFGHLSVGNCARVVLRRDPSARSLIWGSVTAQAAAIALYSIRVLAVNGAIAPQVLAGQSGTALIPLADRVGPSVRVLGSVYVILGMGMASVHVSLGLFNLVRERLPTRPRPILVLPRRRGRLLLRSSRSGTTDEDLRIGLTYLGLENGQPHFRADLQLGGDTHHVETAVAERWDARELLDRLPASAQRVKQALRARGARLTLEVLEASQENVRLRVTSTMSLTYVGDWDVTGLRMGDLMALPHPLGQLVNWMMRRGEVSLPDVAAYTGQDEGPASATLKALVDQGFVRQIEVEGETRYRVQLAPKRGYQLPQDIMKALGEQGRATKDEGRPAFVGRRWSFVGHLGERGRFLLAVSPVAVVFLLTEWLFFAGVESFARLISFLGVITVPLLGGIFPVLLLVSSRRKGEFVPEVVYRFLGHPLLVVGTYLLFLTSLLLHGLIIWQNPMERAGALLVGLLVLGVTITMARRGVFAPRAVVALREDQDEEDQAAFAIVAGGQPAVAEVGLRYRDREQRRQAAAGEVPAFSSLRYAVFRLPVGDARELKVWAYRITSEGDAESLPVQVEAHSGDETTRCDLQLAGGQVLLPLPSDPFEFKITFSE